MTDKCEKCGALYGEEMRVGDKTYCVCEYCRDSMYELANGACMAYLNGSAFLLGFKGREIPELKRLFALSKNEDIRKMVKFLEDVESDMPKEEEE